MSERVETKVIASAAFTSPWYEIGPPNGCLAKHQERRVSHVEIYEADYYGRGSKLYARGYTTLETPEHKGSQRSGQWDDGDPVRVAQWHVKIKLAITLRCKFGCTQTVEAVEGAIGYQCRSHFSIMWIENQSEAA